MTNPIPPALRLLAHFWLAEVQADDAATLTALPELAETLLETDAATLDRLAVEYQRLFGFNLPPYESVFIDPSAMLQAPATERVQALYRRGGWQPPPKTRSGAADHLGLELLALADWLETGRVDLSRQLHTRHLALWGPPFLVALRRLQPHPFYETLAELTLDLLLSTLPAVAIPPDDLFPDLPPPPVYRASDETPVAESPEEEPPDSDDRPSPRRFMRHLLTPRQAGFFLTREDIARLSQRLDVPGGVGERFRMLDSLFRLAMQYDLWEPLFDQLGHVVLEFRQDYQHLTASYPTWASYEQAWGERLAATQTALRKARP